MKRISVVGTSGSGKTTVAGRLSALLEIPHIELDAVYWQPNWEGLPDDQFRERIAELTAGDTWVVDGNYSRVRSVVWARADTVVWLDYPLRVILWQMFGRVLRRWRTQENLWGTGNRESLFRHFFTRDSLFWWIFKTYRRRKREYPVLLQQPEYAHLELVQLRSTGETERWLAEITLHNRA